MNVLSKKTLSMLLALILVFNTTGICQAKGGVNNNDTKETELCSAEEVEAYIESAEGITCTEMEEESVTIEDAVDEVFHSEDIEEAELEESKITEYEDTKYITEIYEEGNTTYVKTYSEDRMQMSIVSYDGVIINSDNYSYNAETGEYEKQHMELICEESQTESENNVWAQAVSYNSKTKSAKWKDTVYWYQTGNNGKKTYLKIGCKATYNIRTDNLSSAKDKKCDAYMSAVKSSKSYEKKALAYASAAGISGTTIIALVLANATFPPSTIITIVFGILGGGATIHNAINCTVDSFEKWQDAKDTYNVIKSYGTKL